MPTAYVALGSNLGDRETALRRGVKEMREGGLQVTAGSRIYESSPVGKTDQPDFLNGAVAVEASIPPRELLELLLGFERALGRVRDEKWGPRTLDLDLLMYGHEVVKEEGLQVPHPRMHERPFVMLPLCDLNPDGRHPTLGMTFRELADSLHPIMGIRRLEGDGLLPGEE